MQVDDIIDIGYIVCGFASFAALGVYFVVFRKRVRNARIRNADGSLRVPTAKESMAIAESIAGDPGRHFWHLIAWGAVLVFIVWLVIKWLGLIGTGK